MEFTSERVFERKLKAVENAIYSDVLILSKWQKKQGYYTSPGEYTDCGQWEEFTLGDRWSCKDGTTCWFKTTIEIPEAYNGKYVVLELEFGGEALVRINGAIQSALTSYLAENEAARTRVVLPHIPSAGERFDIEVEAGMNYMEFARYRLEGRTSVEYQFRRALLAVVDQNVEQYYFDIKTAYDAMMALKSPIEKLTAANVRLPFEMTRILESFTKDSYIYQKIRDAVLHSLTRIDADMGLEALVKSIPAAAETLREKLAQIPHSPHALIKFVGQAHIDTAWLWPIKETIRKCGKTIANVLDLMERYEDFIFAFSQPQLFEYTKDYYPELYERVKQKVKSGQFELVGNTWVEMDTNIPSGESLVRQLLYGRAFFQKEFGKVSRVFWMPDVFGYSWALPQIIKRSGMEYFFTSKLINNDTNNFPYSLFMWQGIDGTRILSYVQRLNYNGRYNPETVETIYNRFDQKNLTDNLLMTFGYGDGGGGPTYQMLETGRRLKSFPGLQKTEMNTSVSFFDAVDPIKDQLPVWNNEMYYEFHRGTYTSQARIKKNNRKAELGMRHAEMLAAVAKDMYGADYPYEDILKAYKLILTNQFHDIIPGSSIHDVYIDSEKDYKYVFDIIKKIEEDAVEHLTTPAQWDKVVVFNSLSWDRTGYVRVPLPAGLPDAAVVNAQGNPVPSVCRDGWLEFEAWAPALGAASYCIAKRGVHAESNIFVGKDRMENDFYIIHLDDNGNLTSIYDKRNNCEVLEQGRASNLLQIFEDKPYCETAWNIDLEYQNKCWNLAEGTVEVLEQSSLKGIIRVTRKFNLSTIIQDITIYRSIPRIDFCTRVDWNETEKMLKAAFHVNVLSSKAVYEIQFGSIERPTHWNTSYDKAKFEVCGHKWADLSEGGYGVSLLNDCKYGYDIKDNCMRITLLRSPVDPDPEADKGIHEMCYSLLPHAGDHRQGRTVKAGYELNVPLKAVMGRCVARDGSYAEISRDNVIIDTIKCAEDGRGMIMRVYESEGIRGKTAIKLSFTAAEVFECNLMEEDEKLICRNTSSFEFFIKPYEIKTFRIFRVQD
ncbi:MAG TPA: alpha-mannosidase [Clostridiales bacterium]|nr:alpha-mannosidase [Clostridiales bacterium]